MLKVCIVIILLCAALRAVGYDFTFTVREQIDPLEFVADLALLSGLLYVLIDVLLAYLRGRRAAPPDMHTDNEEDSACDEGKGATVLSLTAWRAARYEVP